jgi:hypothetical protein
MKNVASPGRLLKRRFARNKSASVPLEREA